MRAVVRLEAMNSVTAFTPWSAAAGGVLIGTAAVGLWWATGRIAGVSGIAAGWWRDDRAWRLAFLAGLMAGTGVLAALSLPAATPRSGTSPLLLVSAGLLVGWGTSMAHGCTSGHGVCGLARGSMRSLIAVAVFLGCAVVTVALLRHGLAA